MNVKSSFSPEASRTVGLLQGMPLHMPDKLNPGHQTSFSLQPMHRLPNAALVVAGQ